VVFLLDKTAKGIEEKQKTLKSSVHYCSQITSGIITFVSVFLRTRASIGFELVAVRSQLAVCQHRIEQKKEPRPRFNAAFRLIWAILSKLWHGWRSSAYLMQPDTVIRWQRNAFRLWWRWKSRPKRGRPPISREMQALIRRLCKENALWSAERIYGHLKLLGFDPPCPDTIRKYMVKSTRGRRKSQSWLTFLRNHMTNSWAMDFFTVPTIRFEILYVLVIMEHSTRKFIRWAVTESPSMEWTVQQLREATPFDQRPKYLLRDNDAIYGNGVPEFLKSCGIKEIRIAYRSPWQNPFAERVIGTLRRELLNHVIIFNQRHLRSLLKEFIEDYYHTERPHLGLLGNTPAPKVIPEDLPDPDKLISIPILGGLHHKYRVAA